jgi:hypothetical protein
MESTWSFKAKPELPAEIQDVLAQLGPRRLQPKNKKKLPTHARRFKTYSSVFLKK